jgi:hypothetical protein
MTGNRPEASFSSDEGVLAADLQGSNLSQGDHVSGELSIEQLLAKYPLVTRIEELQVIVSRGLNKPWDIATDGDIKIILLPRNIEELMQKHYLFRLYLAILMKEGYKAHYSEQNYSTRMRQDMNIDIYLKSFGMLPETGCLPDLPKNKGYVWKGIASAIDVYLNGQKNLDRSLMKVSNAPIPSTVVFGDAWGKNYPTEKYMLDRIIHYIRQMTIVQGKLGNVLISKEKIISDKGLNVSIKSDLITDSEKSFIEWWVQKEKMQLEFELDIPDMDGVELIYHVQSLIRERQKSVKRIKDLLKTVSSRRVTACFSPYKGARRKQVQKVPIKDLKDEIKGTKEWEAFNPTVWVQLYGLSPISSYAPQNEAQDEKLTKAQDALFSALVAAGCNESTVMGLLTEHNKYLSGTISE